MKATAKDLRFRSRELLESVGRGEEVVITFRGKPCAKLVPLDAEDEQSGTNVAHRLFGMWKDHDLSADVPAYVRALREDRFS